MRLAHDAIALVTSPAPRIAVEDFLALPIDGERLLWDPGASEEWAFAGRGVAARVEARGTDRFEGARDGAARVFASILEADRAPEPSPAPSPAPPSVRLFGGLSFEAGGGDAGPWRGFSDASFVMPRWLYCVSARVAFVRVAAPIRELGAIERELANLILAMAGGDARANDRARCERMDLFARFASLARESSVAPRRVKEEIVDRSTLEEWDALVKDALRSIRSHDFEKVVAARRTVMSLEEPIDVGAALTRMRAVEPGCTRFAFERERAVFLGATPERLVRLTGARVETEALAGSLAHRGALTDEVRALLGSGKDRREHALVVDGIRAALAPYCASIDAPQVPSVRTLRAVHHLWTPIVATLREPAHVLDLARVIHPTPAVCGLPRQPARGWIAAHERASRGWYASPIGWIDASGEGSLAVGIRSALVQHREAWLFSGAGIVEGSDPSLEYRETTLKQSTMLAALGGLP